MGDRVHNLLGAALFFSVAAMVLGIAGSFTNLVTGELTSRRLAFLSTTFVGQTSTTLHLSRYPQVRLLSAQIQFLLRSLSFRHALVAVVIV